MKRLLGNIAATFLVLMLVGATATRAQAPTFTVLHSFNGTDGAEPFFTGLIQATDGNFYGTTEFGGANPGPGLGGGTVFKITPSGTLTTLYSFCSQSGCTDGNAPLAGLIQATDGNFYGTTTVGGARGLGTVFKITPGGTLTTLYSFCSQSGCTDGRNPAAALIQATDGNFYGTTDVGGANPGPFGSGGGTVFKITPSGTLTTLYSFCSQSGCTDGQGPEAALIQATDGNFYGTTEAGGANPGPFGDGGGTVFKITPSGTLTTLYSFCSQNGCTDGLTSGFAGGAGLVQATDGNFYGTTSGGGTTFGGPGTVFKITPSGTLTTLHSFGGVDGSVPLAGLIQATDGNFYGTTQIGGANPGPSGFGGGTVFKITPNGTLSTLYSFCSQSGCTDGWQPLAELVQATDGNFYGTTAVGGSGGSACPSPGGCGTVFKLTVQAPPTISSISPTSAIAGGPAFTLTVKGTNFVSGSTVNFNGNGRTTTFVSATQLTAIILASDIATAGSFNLTVTNPGGRTSNAVSFTVVTPQDATETIANSVNVLFSQGVINGGQNNSLVVQLQHAISMMNAGKNAGAIGNLDSFISEVNDLLNSGVLTPSQAAALISAAQSVIAALP